MYTLDSWRGDEVRPRPTRSLACMMSSKAVPCPCPFCKGKIVSVYVRRQHVAKFCSPVDSRAGVTHSDTGTAETVSDSQVSHGMRIGEARESYMNR